MGIAKNAVENNSLAVDQLRGSIKQDIENYKAQIREKLGNNLSSQVVNGVLVALSETTDFGLLGVDAVFDATSVIFTCAIGDSYCQQAQKDLSGKGQGVQDAVNAVINGDAWDSIQLTLQKANKGDQEALENLTGLLITALAPSSKGVSAIKDIKIVNQQGSNIVKKGLIIVDDTFTKAKDFLKGEVTVYRVEGSPNQRLLINEKGDVYIINDKTTLYLNFGSKKRAIEYFQQKIDKGLPDVTLKKFTVPRDFRAFLEEIAVSEREIKLYDPNRIKPVIADPTKSKHQYGLREEQIRLLKENIIKGSGKNEN